MLFISFSLPRNLFYTTPHVGRSRSRRTFPSLPMTSRWRLCVYATSLALLHLGAGVPSNGTARMYRAFALPFQTLFGARFTYVILNLPTIYVQEALLRRAVPREWAYSAEQVTDMSPVKRIHEQVREKYMTIGTELPYLFTQVWNAHSRVAVPRIPAHFFFGGRPRM